jgi:hypothetical protein
MLSPNTRMMVIRTILKLGWKPYRRHTGALMGLKYPYAFKVYASRKMIRFFFAVHHDVKINGKPTVITKRLHAWFSPDRAAEELSKDFLPKVINQTHRLME